MTESIARSINFESYWTFIKVICNNPPRMAGLNREWLLVTALDDSNSIFFRYRNTGCFVTNHILSFINIRLYKKLLRVYLLSLIHITILSYAAWVMQRTSICWGKGKNKFIYVYFSYLNLHLNWFIWYGIRKIHRLRILC